MVAECRSPGCGREASKMESLEELFDRVIRAVHDLGRESRDGWTSWYKVSVRAQGNLWRNLACELGRKSAAYR